MEKPQERFGEYLKELRRVKRVTLQQLADSLDGISISYISDIENGRKKPFSPENMERAANRLSLTGKERHDFFDIAAREKDSTPDDIKETIMYSEWSDDIRLACRLTNSGKIPQTAWKEFTDKFTEVHEKGHIELHTKKEDEPNA